MEVEQGIVRRSKGKLRIETARGSPSSKFGWSDFVKEGKGMRRKEVMRWRSRLQLNCDGMDTFREAQRRRSGNNRGKRACMGVWAGVGVGHGVFRENQEGRTRARDT